MAQIDRSNGWLIGPIFCRSPAHEGRVEYTWRRRNDWPVNHRKYTGVSNQLILSNLEALSEHGALIHIRFPLIPGVNDSLAHAERAGAFLQGLDGVKGVDILPYHDAAGSKYKRFGWLYRLGHITAPDYNHIRRIAAAFSSFGLRATIGGDNYERAGSQAQTSQP